MATLEISIVPVGTSTTSLSSYIAACQRILASVPGIVYELGPMGTSIEGNMPALLDIVGRLHESPFQAGASRVYTVIKIDDRRDKPSSLASKIASVKNRLV